MQKLMLFILIVLMSFSCAKETIEPAWDARTIDQQRDGKPFTVSIPIEEMSVDRFGEDFGDVGEVGDIFQDLATMIADIQIDDEDGAEIPIEASVFSFPELDRVDFSFLSRIDISKVLIEAHSEDDGSTDTEDSADSMKGMEFIKKLEIYLSFDPSIVEEESISNEDEGSNKDGETSAVPKTDFKDSILLLSYDKIKDERRIGCLGFCIDLKVHKVNWKQILSENRDFVVRTRLVVSSVPKKKMKLKGTLEIAAKLNPKY